MKKLSTLDHYELLIDEDNDPFRDPDELKAYMQNWDGPLFFEALSPKGKVLLEVGIGTGRVADQVLRAGCKSLVGLDISPKSLARARENLKAAQNLELIQEDITVFDQPRFYDYFDGAYSVLTFLHIEDKPSALAHIYRALRPGGTLVLSVSHDEETLTINDRVIKLHPLDPARYCELMETLGFRIESVKATTSNYATIVVAIKEDLWTTKLRG